MVDERDFWSLIEKPPGLDGCWIWRGSVHASVAGVWHGRVSAPLRLPALAVGEDPGPTAPVRQTCGERLCCNPSHLVVGRWSDVQMARGDRPNVNNRHSRARGVYPHRNGRWCAQVKIDGHPRHLGVYASIAEAQEAVRRARRELFGDC